MSDFDPYYKWLGIPPADQPVSHYRLLGLNEFEADPEVIASAADRQMAHIKAFASGPHAVESQQLLNVLARVRICLLHEQKKADYDKRLRRVQANIQSQVTQSFISTPHESASQPLQQDFPLVRIQPGSIRKTKRRPKQRKRLVRHVLLANFFIIAIGGCVAAILLWHLKQSAPQPTSERTHLPLFAKHKVPESRSRAPHVDDHREPELPEDGKSQVPKENPAKPKRIEQEQPLEKTAVEELEKRAWTPPTALTLPEVVDEPVILTEFPHLINLSVLQIEIIEPDFLQDRHRSFLLHNSDKTNKDKRWSVVELSAAQRRDIERTGELGTATPLAVFRAHNQNLSFVWTSHSDEELRSRLRMCLLKITYDAKSHYSQLINPVVDAFPIVLEDRNDKYVLSVAYGDLPVLPPRSELMVHIQLPENLPSNRPKLADSNRLPVNEQLIVAFPDAENAGLGVFWRAYARKVQVSIAPGFELNSAPGKVEVLSTKTILEIEKTLNDEIESAKFESNRLNSTLPRLRQRLASLEASTVVGPTREVRISRQLLKNDAVGKARITLQQAEHRIKNRQVFLKSATQDIDNLTRLSRLCRKLSSKRIGIEFFLPVGSYKVVLYRKGMTSL